MPLPAKWRRFFVGRKVIHPTKKKLNGVVKYATSTRLGQSNPQGLPGAAIISAFYIEWTDGTSEVMEDTEVAKIATDEFAKEDWVLDTVLKLQESGWDQAKASEAANGGAGPSGLPKSKGKAAAPKPKPAPKSNKDTTPTRHAVATTLADLKRKAAMTPSPSPQAKKPAPSPASRDPHVRSFPTKSARPSVGEPSKKEQPTNETAAKNGKAIATRTATSPRRPPPTAAAPAATSPFPVPSPRVPFAERVVSPMLHVTTLNFAKVRGKDIYQYDNVTLAGVKYRVYSRDLVIPADVCFRAVPGDGKPKDLTIEAWKVRGKYNESDEYLVDCIAAERTVGKKGQKEYLIKYAGFELCVGSENWQSRQEVEEMEAFDKWVKGKREKWIKGMAAVKRAAGVV